MKHKRETVSIATFFGIIASMYFLIGVFQGSLVIAGCGLTLALTLFVALKKITKEA